MAKPQRQLCEPENHVGCALARARSRSRCDRLVAVEHRVESDMRLDSCQRRPKAIVDAAAECEVAGPVALDVELLGVRKRSRIAVGRPETDRDARVGEDSALADLGIVTDEAI